MSVADLQTPKNLEFACEEKNFKKKFEHAPADTSDEFANHGTEQQLSQDVSEEMDEARKVVSKEETKSLSSGQDQRLEAPIEPLSSEEASDDESISAHDAFAKVRKRARFASLLSSSEEDDAARQIKELQAEAVDEDEEKRMLDEADRRQQKEHIGVNESVLSNAVGDDDDDERRRRKKEKKKRKKEKKRLEKKKKKKRKVLHSESSESERAAAEKDGSASDEGSASDDGFEKKNPSKRLKKANEKVLKATAMMKESNRLGGGPGSSYESAMKAGELRDKAMLLAAEAEAEMNASDDEASSSVVRSEEVEKTAEQKAETAKQGKDVDLVPVVWPQDNAIFTGIFRPLLDVGNNNVFGALLVRTVTANNMQVRETLLAKAGERHAPHVRAELEYAEDTPHACESLSALERMHVACNMAFDEHDVQEMRRSAEWRSDTRTFARRWVYTVLCMKNAALGSASEFSNCIGAYRVQCRARASEIFGVTGGDFAAAACEELIDSKPKSPNSIKQLAYGNALCLTEKEMRVVTFDQPQVTKFLSRRTTEKGASNVSISCFAGLPLTCNKSITLECEGVGLSASGNGADIEPFCELLPPSFTDTVRVRRCASASANSAAEAAKMAALVRVEPTYNVGTVLRIMHGAFFDSSFFCVGSIGSHGDTNVMLNDGQVVGDGVTADEREEEREDRAYDAAQGVQRDEKVEEAKRKVNREERLKRIRQSPCYAVSHTAEVYSLCAEINSGEEFRKRMRGKIQDMFTSVLGSKTAVLDAGKIRASWRRAREVRERVKEHSSGVGYETEIRAHQSVNRFLAWFSDAFMARDAHFALAAEAFGLRHARALYYEEDGMQLCANLRDSPVPYALLFGPEMQGRRARLVHAVRPLFLPWMRLRRSEAYAALLAKSNRDTEAAKMQEVAQVIEVIMKAVSSLNIARLVEERCVPLFVNCDDAIAQVALSVANVNDSAVRLVSAEKDGAKNCLFLSDAGDFEVETALCSELIDFAVATTTNCGVMGGTDAKGETERRLVLHRCGDADDCVNAVAKEFKDDNDEKHGRVLVVLMDACDRAAAREAMRAAAVSHYMILTEEELVDECNGGAGYKEGCTWPQFCTRVLFYNAHRFPFEVLLRVVATLKGHDAAPRVPRSLTRVEYNERSQEYYHLHGVAPEDDFESNINAQRIREFTVFAARCKDVKVREALEEEYPERAWGGAEESRARTRFIFIYVAYAQCDTERSVRKGGTQNASGGTHNVNAQTEKHYALEKDLDLAPHGQFCESVYFGMPTHKVNLAAGEELVDLDNAQHRDCERMEHHNNYWRVEELYESTTSLGAALREAVRSTKVMCLDERLDVHSSVSASAIKDFISNKQREGMMRWCEDDVNKRMHSHKKKQRAAERAAHDLGNSTINFDSKPLFEAGVIVPQWMRGEAHLPGYVPTSFDRMQRETAPKAMNMRATSLTKRTVDAEVGLRKVKVTLVLSADPSTERRAAINARLASSNIFNADISGFGRTAMLEVMARLRVERTHFVIVGEALRALVERCLAPNPQRASISLSQDVPRLRNCPTLWEEKAFIEELLPRAASGMARTRLDLFRQRPYYACLQCSSAYTWASAMRVTADAVNKLEQEVLNAMTEEEEVGAQQMDEREDGDGK